jgi:hypothetical protein
VRRLMGDPIPSDQHYPSECSERQAIDPLPMVSIMCVDAKQMGWLRHAGPLHRPSSSVSSNYGDGVPPKPPHG